MQTGDIECEAVSTFEHFEFRVEGTPTKLQRKFVGPFRAVECIGSQSYKLALPSHW